MSTLTRGSCLALVLSIPLASAAWARQSVPREVVTNAIAGFSMELPEDWEMCTGDMGATMIALDADGGTPTAAVFPVIWFFRTTESPEAMAASIARALGGADASSPAIAEGPNGERVVTATSAGPRGPLVESWHCRQEGDACYVVATMVRPERAADFAGDLDAAVASCRLIGTPSLKLFTEPTEGAYRMVLPADWRWSGNVIRTREVPGYFQWEATALDGLAGAFSAPPAVFNIAVPYTEASEAAAEIVLPALQAKLPGARLESVRELPRPGEYYEAVIRRLGIGERPRVSKARADYVATVGGTEVRARITIATFMLDASPVLGGRGNWTMLAGGYWAPEGRFEELGAVGRGVVSSIMTDPEFKRSQFEASNEVAVWSAWNRDLSFWRFMVRLWSN